MTAPSTFPDASVGLSHPNNITGSLKMSSGFLSAEKSPRSFDAHLRDAWVELINKHFQTPEHAAVFFGVSEKTARNWATGTCGPRGGPVAYAMKHMPVAAAALLGDA